MSEAITPSDDLDKVIPSPHTVDIKGQPFEVRQFKVRQLKQVLAVCAPLYEKIKANKGPVKAEILKLIITDTDEVVSLVAFMAGQPKDWVDDLDMREFGDLFLKILEVNFDFFIQNVLPSLLAAMEDVNKAVAKAPGLKSSRS